MIALLGILFCLFVASAVGVGVHWTYIWLDSRRRWDRPKPTPLLKRRRH